MLSAILSFSLLFIGCDEDQTAALDCCVSDLEAAVDAWQDSEAGGDIAVDVSLPDGKPPDGGGDEAGMDQGGGDASSDSSGGDAGNP